MNLSMHRTRIHGIIDYVDNTLNKEPGIIIETSYGELWNYFGNTVAI